MDQVKLKSKGSKLKIKKGSGKRKREEEPTSAVKDGDAVNTKVVKLKKSSKKLQKPTTATKSLVEQVPKSTAAADESSDDTVLVPTTTFKALGLHPTLCEACEAMGWKVPTGIQVEAIPAALKGGDIIGLAETGSGKTGAFALPVLNALLSYQGPKGTYCLVLAPTRELAFQIRETFESLGSFIGLKTAAIIGGIDMVSQAIALQKKPHVIVATPGRIVDHLENTKGFHLKNLKFLVMDEADRILNDDFEEEVDKLLENVPDDRATYLFSATMTSKVRKLQRAALSDPIKIEVSSKYHTVDKLIQKYIFVPQKFKDCYLVHVLTELMGNSFMIFCSTCNTTQRISLVLRDLGFNAICLHGQMTQPKRLGALSKFSAQRCNIIVATDVASRGLDIPHVDCVINYDIPMHSKDYIHRVGRTARAGRSGRAINIVTQYDVELYQRIEQLIGKKLEQHACEESDVMQLSQRVSEAQRTAHAELREMTEAKKLKGGAPGQKRYKGRS
eukprot:m.10950 g.10950  ORF g.10950 m.10950 type:complete len:502 (+) comp8561_c0_seq1:161-1666(+)